MFNIFYQKLELIDNAVSQKITNDLIPYDLHATNGVITKQLPLFIKIVFYSVILIIPFLIWKLLQPLNKKLNIILIVLLFIIGIFVFGVFLGFLQILYS